ncbi:hypothetical protein BKA82DRAFT_4013051 [Pisolithus tinctorius]|nr:hypothetical protein BKA82DRAFT_4013051 [Pisolithus tinctorius]
MWLLMSGREEDEVSSSRRDGEQYAKTEEGQGWPEQRSRTQCIQGDVDPDTEPKSKVLDRVEAQSLISEGKEDGTSSWVECEEYPGAKEKAIDGDGRLEAVHQYLASRLRPPDCEVEGRRPRSNKVSTFTRRGRRPIIEESSRIYRLKVTAFIIVQTCATSRYFVSSSEQVVDEDGRLEVARRHLVQELWPPDWYQMKYEKSSVRVHRESGL